ncbi:unnamed protein product [Pocillopora meandrina]|uniref:Uncharacterized protein n=1 Tax=Pocillopora meandrina TaxID=46732 RepID=A0AAU9XHV6_9CNID|nr:unnamed protein product [Pocillopora meandrina]
MPVKMAAFKSMAKQLQPFLAIFQSDNPLLPFMASTLQEMIVGLMKRYVKAGVLQKATSAVKLLKLDLSDVKNFLEIKKVDIGLVAVDKLKKLQADKKIYQFKSEFQSFLTTIVGKLFEKTPIAYTLARNLTCLDPNLIVTDKEGCCAKFNVVLSKLVKCSRLNIRDCDPLVLQYSEFLDLAIKAEKSAFEEFNFKVDRLDIFLQKQIGSVSSLSKLWDLLRELLILSNPSQATVESFSVNWQVMIKNSKEKTFVARCTIHDHIQSIGGLVQLVVYKELHVVASAGRQRYSAYLEEQKKEQQQAFQNRKRKIVFEEKAEFEEKEKRLASEISALQLDVDSLAKEAEEKSKLVLVTKSNALRKAAKGKERALKKIKDELRELAKKSASL